MILTYNTKDRDGSTTYGGYSDIMVTDEHYAVAIPDNLPLDWAPPSLCAGITAYSPLKNYGHNRPGLHVGVVGLGGLGHVTVKFAKAMGPKVTVISTSPSKKEEAIDRLGADWFLVSSDPEQMQVGTMVSKMYIFFRWEDSGWELHRGADGDARNDKLRFRAQYNI
ncbi:hypothetical protein CRG98_018144 [Punica granatum]|uniref:Alcohol dehydrogenase-like C-terminal domain-containing protein n=1 Tax=Punica granatum TaxID=22663 RepID=A0A2I0JYR8_PUNGR|nr:hypothetical protein CRG98_018144 [Punica granatum]